MNALDPSAASAESVLDRVSALGVSALPVSTLALLRDGFRLGLLPDRSAFANDVIRTLRASNIDRALRMTPSDSATAADIAFLRRVNRGDLPTDTLAVLAADLVLTLAAHVQALEGAGARHVRPIATRSPRLPIAAAVGVLAALVTARAGLNGPALTAAWFAVPVLTVLLLFGVRRPRQGVLAAPTGVTRLDFQAACRWADRVEHRSRRTTSPSRLRQLALDTSLSSDARN